MVSSSLKYCLSVYPQTASMRALANHAGVSLTNFRHYFPTESDLRMALNLYLAKKQAKTASHYAAFALQSPRTGLTALIRAFYSDWNSGLGLEYALQQRFSAFESESTDVDFQPMSAVVDAVGLCLKTYMKRRQIRQGNDHLAALMLMAPALFRLSPMLKANVDDPWIEKHVSAFLKGWW